MEDRTGGERMICPRCGVEQPKAVECVHCSIVVARFKPRRYNWRQEAPTFTVGVVFSLVMVAISAWMLWRAIVPLTEEAPIVTALPRPPDVTTRGDPSVLDTHWSRGAAGFRAAVASQIDLRVPMLVYFHNRDCPSCVALQSTLFVSPAFEGWIQDGLRVEVVVDDGPEDKALADKFGVTTLPALWVVRSNGQRKAVALMAGEAPVEAAAFVASLKAAAGR